MAKNYYMVFDTETCGKVVFDFGYKVVDRKGNMVAEGSFVCAEFINDPYMLDMFNDQYTKTKIAGYYFSLYANRGEFEVMPFAEIRETVNRVQQAFNAKVCAYNAKFDKGHLQQTAQYFGFAEFFNAPVEWVDLWAVALSTITNNRNYVKFCAKHNFLSNKGKGENMSTNAETVYSYLTNNPNFKEAHTARADCEIEAEILRRAFVKKKAIRTGIVGCCTRNSDWVATCEKWQALFA